MKVKRYLEYALDTLQVSHEEIEELSLQELQTRVMKAENTTDDYWDCECKEDYINEKSKKKHCRWCNTSMEDQPDSRVSELGVTHCDTSDGAQT